MGKASRARNEQRANDIAYLVKAAKEDGLFPEMGTEEDYHKALSDMGTHELHDLRVAREQIRTPYIRPRVRHKPPWIRCAGAMGLLSILAR